MPLAWGAACALSLFSVAAIAQPAQDPAVFHSQTRLVEVEVVVRDPPVRPPGAAAWFDWVFDSGPPFGPPGVSHASLTKDDFTLLDDGRPRQIAVFRAGLDSSQTGRGESGALAPGTVSNRQDSRGRAVKGATAILIDFLNTRFGCRGYERSGMTRFLRSFAGTGGRTALYTLGENLHLLRDFGDDPQKLVKAAEVLNRPAGRSSSVPDDAASDLGDIISVGGPEAESEADQVHRPMTEKALKIVLQHLSGAPGRKNLIWLMENPLRVPPATMAMAQQANVVVYPVLLRLVGGSGFGPDASCVGVPRTGLARDMAEITGGRAFFDVMDLKFAVQAAQEDTSAAYVLGFYPPEETLNGKYHTITVKIRKAALQKHDGEIHYRPGYIASKAAALSPAAPAATLLNSPFESAGIGLTGEAAPEAGHTGRYDVRVTADLHDIHLEHKDGHFTGAFDLSVLTPSGQGKVTTGAFAVDVPDERLVEAVAAGFVVHVTGAESDSGEICVAVRDRSTGIAGSLRIPAKDPAAR